MIEAHHRQLSHQLLKKATQFLKSKLFSVQSYSLIGDSREEIANKIKDFKVNLLVVGNCGMGIIKRTFVGSTCDYLVHHAHCPVMVVKSRLSGHIPGPEPDETISSQLLQRNLIL
jgi:nucleotide-binding universal stress UspA family protein